MASLSLLQLPDVEAMSAEECLLWAYDRFGDKLCLTCSWQKQSSVLVHMVSELGIDIPVIELDTGLFFAETYETRERLVERYGLELVRPEVITVAEQHKQEGPNLWERNPDRCCHVRKVEPLERVLKDFDAWISGIRREQSLTRKDAQRVEFSDRYDVWKVQPLVDWDAKRVDAYIHVNEIPYNPLHDAGYPSIGCIPCTRGPVELATQDERRRAGSGRLRLTRCECAHPRKSTRASDEASPSGSPASPGPGRRPSPSSSPRSWSAAACSSSGSTATSCARTSRTGSASRRPTATRTSSASAGSPRG